MAEITRGAVARVGVDLSKRVFQVHAVDRAGHVLLARAFAPERFFAWCAELPAGCLVAMEACGGAHHVRSARQPAGRTCASCRSRRTVQTAPRAGTATGEVTIRHPFHPLFSKSFEVLKRRRVSGVDTLTLRHVDHGTLTVPREWTDLADPDPLSELGQPAARLNPILLLELAELLRQLELLHANET
jgi:hypothetical protein